MFTFVGAVPHVPVVTTLTVKTAPIVPLGFKILAVVLANVCVTVPLALVSVAAVVTVFVPSLIENVGNDPAVQANALFGVQLKV